MSGKCKDARCVSHYLISLKDVAIKVLQKAH
ncbi:hypothetical protein [Inovirus D_HF5_61]|nr:hypothetical protein [Inovirus D_HF5_61]DAR03084.1 MAG TPA: hypothetical protein [Inoviridae sp.]